ncbi:MAG: hypothetical protein ACTHNP_06500 [Solirubrobacterales bacterium]
MESRQNNYSLTPADEERFFKNNPELAKAMENLEDEQSRRRMEETCLEFERLVEELGRILDG